MKLAENLLAKSPKKIIKKLKNELRNSDVPLQKIVKIIFEKILQNKI